MKKLFLFLLLLSITIDAQVNRCATAEYVQTFYQNNPSALTKANDIKNLISEKGYLLTKNDSPFIIPVVVHVIYKVPAENISNEQIISQVDALNRDYRKQNADAANTPEIFSNLVADVNIEFKLASFDPDGNPTTGITRTSTDISQFGEYSDEMKFTSQGGHDIWDREHYLNIWVCNFEALGRSSFPVWDPSTDGIIICYNAFGTTGTLRENYNNGRTAVHEVGHWLGLYHIWGDDGGTCDIDDDVDDTPMQAEKNFGCPTFPNPSCNNTSDMFMNYMDYSNDACMYMFTNGQKQRMHSYLFTARNTLQSSLEVSPGIISEIPFEGDVYSITITNTNANSTINWTIEESSIGLQISHRLLEPEMLL